MSIARAEWPIWSTTASIVVTAPEALAAAETIARSALREVDDACNRFRADSEISRLDASGALARGATVSPLLARLVRAALEAASRTHGAVDPTLGNDLIALGYDRDFARVEARTPDVLAAESTTADTVAMKVIAAETAQARVTLTMLRSPGWERIVLDGDTLTVPTDLRLDLGATAKAVAADLIAARVAGELGTGVLVSLGGDIATAGAGPDGQAWEVLVQDLPADPAQQIALTPGSALATSSTQKRRWTHAGNPVHHILDPRFGTPVEPVWRSATVAAASCLLANALSTAAIVKGRDAVNWLHDQGAAARLVDRDGRTVIIGAWPAEQEANNE